MGGILGKALKGAAEAAKPWAMNQMQQNAIKSRDARMAEFASASKAEDRTYKEGVTASKQEFQTAEREAGEEFKATEAAKRDAAKQGGKYDTTTDIKNIEYMVKHGIASSREDAHAKLSSGDDAKLQASIFRTLMANQDDFAEIKVSPDELYVQAGVMAKSQLGKDTTAGVPAAAPGGAETAPTGEAPAGFPDASSNEGRKGKMNGVRYQAVNGQWVEI